MSLKRERFASPVVPVLPLERLYPSAGPQPKPPKKIKGEDGLVIPQEIPEKRLKLFKKCEFPLSLPLSLSLCPR